MSPADLATLLAIEGADLVQETRVGIARVRALLVDGSFLEVRFNDRGRYSYHWQRGPDSFYRFDNAPHHPDVPSHPHHVHFGTAAEVQSSQVAGVSVPDVTLVLEFIRRKLHG